MKKMVISGINLFEGGPLRVYYDCLDALIECEYYKAYTVDLFVHKKELFEKYNNYFNIIELPKSRKHFINRLYYEYIYFYFKSFKNKVDIWISLHDITPNVKARNRIVYCHSPLIFNPDLKKITMNNYKKFIYAKLYKLLYRCNIRKNNYVIVQQEWMRKEFKKIFGIDNIVVARPIVKKFDIFDKTMLNEEYIFFYPALPRFFKNFEVICEASRLLQDQCGQKYKILLTIDGTENQYAKQIVDKYKGDKHIEFIGLQDFSNMVLCYEKTDCLIFPSKLETWGLPISEFANSGRPMILANLPYAHEAVGNYEKVNFFEVEDPYQLAEQMSKVMKLCPDFEGNTLERVMPPLFENWSGLLDFIIEEDRKGEI